MPDIGAMLEAHLGPIAKSNDRIAAALEADAAIRAAVRGIKDMRVALPVAGLPSVTALPPPDQGYAWNLKLVTGTLSANDSVAVYISNDASEVPNNRLIGYAGPPGAAPAQPLFVVSWSADQGLLKPGEGVVLQTSGTGKFTRAMAVAVQVPAEMIGKILS